MALPDYQDPDTGEPIPRPPSPDAPQPPATTPGGSGTDPAKRKADIVNGYIIPYYRQRAKRDPTQAEIDSDYEVYERHGGETLRKSIDDRFPVGNFTWPEGSDFGAPPAPFGEDYTAGTYVPPEFTEPFEAPTAESLYNDPGYKARLEATQRGSERMAAAKGSILSGGFVGRTLPRQLGEFASNEYSNAFGRAFDTYRQRYGQFSDSAARGADAFRVNEAGKLNQYNTRYTSYQDLIRNRRNAETDRWGREMDLSRLGADTTAAGAPR